MNCKAKTVELAVGGLDGAWETEIGQTDSGKDEV